MSFTEETSAIRHVSRCTIKPRRVSEESLYPYYLPAQDLAELPGDYNQKGFLFSRPQHTASIQPILEQLKDSLSTALSYFYPLAGRLVTIRIPNTTSCTVFLDCKDGGPGVAFVHAVAHGTSTSDILSPIDISPLVESLFPLHRPVNHDGHTLPQLAVQITELVDGIFIGCCFNHVVGDGVSFTNFCNAWSEISRAGKYNFEGTLSHPPVNKRLFVNNQDHFVNLPYSYPTELLQRHISERHRERVFHFTSDSINYLKKKASAGALIKIDKPLSPFQVLAALLWRSITRARRQLADRQTKCSLLFNDRLRMDPPLSPDYFGNCLSEEIITITVGELLSNDLGWAACILQKAVADHTGSRARSEFEAISKAVDDHETVTFLNSPYFPVYKSDFGWGEPIAVRNGYEHHFNGKVTMFPGREGGASIDIEICLISEAMGELETDGEFMGAVSHSPNSCFEFGLDTIPNM